MPNSYRDEDKVFKLPDLNEYLSETGGMGAKDQSIDDIMDSGPKVSRNDMDEYNRLLQLNPFADADDSMFEDEYDVFQSIFGTGKLLGIPVPYLQTGHGILLIVTLLAALVYAPGLPLTEFPPEIRNFLKDGLKVTYGINTVLAGLAFFEARKKNLSGVFWAIKTLLLGGVAYFEITKVVSDPNKPKINNPFEGIDPSDRKSKRR